MYKIVRHASGGLINPPLNFTKNKKKIERKGEKENAKT